MDRGGWWGVVGSGGFAQYGAEKIRKPFRSKT